MKKYSVIYADPPWKQTKGGLRKCRPNQGKQLDYATITIEEIRDIINKVPVEHDHTLFIWTIDKYLDLMGALFGDYRLHARIIWDKENGIAPAFTVRFSHEYLLWFYKGKFQSIEEEFRGKYTTIIREKSTRHSKKPIQAFTMITQFYPYVNKIELFSRYKQISNGTWDFWGNEIINDVELGVSNDERKIIGVNLTNQSPNAD